MKNLFFCLSAGVLMAACLVSCELEDYEEPLEETYTKSFIKSFGLIDKDQDWNMATRAEVSVTTDVTSHIKVYGRVDSTYRLMGDFLDVTGSQKLQFDTPRGVNDLIVSDGSTSLFTTVGQGVNFATMQTRTTHTNDGTDTSTNPLGVKVEKTEEGSDEEYEYFTENSNVDKTGVYYYRNKLPEKVFNVNAEGIDTDFKFSSGDKAYSFIIYPVYWNTSNTITIGIQYTYNGTDYKIPVYTMKSEDELQYEKEEVVTYYERVNPGDFSDWPETLSGKTLDQYSDEDKDVAIEFIKEKKGYTRLDVSNWNDYGSIVYKAYTTKWYSIGNRTESIETDATQYRSKGIKITIPQNTEFLIYCTYNGGTSYSLAEMNETTTYNNETVHIPHISTFLNNKKERCIGFEDYYRKYTGPVAEGSEGEPDLNDLIIYTTLATPENPTPEIEETQSYILAAEDLGNMDDYDFNDMVIKVSTPVENKESTSDDDKYKIKVTALAAGGTLPLKLCRNGEVIKSPIEGLDNVASEQFHAWFGNRGIATSTMINTYSISTTQHTQTIYMSAAEKEAFTMSSLTKDVANKMGGFSFKVKRTEGEDYTTEVKAPENGTAPQMICVPDTWKWPTERTRIDKPYTKFGTWGGNYENIEWLDVISDKSLVLP